MSKNWPWCCCGGGDDDGGGSGSTSSSDGGSEGGGEIPRTCLGCSSGMVPRTLEVTLPDTECYSYITGTYQLEFDPDYDAEEEPSKRKCRWIATREMETPVASGIVELTVTAPVITVVGARVVLHIVPLKGVHVPGFDFGTITFFASMNSRCDYWHMQLDLNTWTVCSGMSLVVEPL